MYEYEYETLELFIGISKRIYTKIFNFHSEAYEFGSLSDIFSIIKQIYKNKTENVGLTMLAHTFTIWPQPEGGGKGEEEVF